MRHSDAWLLDRLDEIDAFMDAGGMDDMTEEERAAFGCQIRDVIAELLDLEAAEDGDGES